MPRPHAYVLLVVGVLTMVGASLWAPPQPEVSQDGAACEVSLCGMLEDPARWRGAWWVWLAGFGALAVAVSVTSRPRRLRPLWVVLGLVSAPVWLVAIFVIAYLVSLDTSVHGAATVFACGLLVPLLAVVSGVIKRKGGDLSPRP